MNLLLKAIYKATTLCVQFGPGAFIWKVSKSEIIFYIHFSFCGISSNQCLRILLPLLLGCREATKKPNEEPLSACNTLVQATLTQI